MFAGLIRHLVISHLQFHAVPSAQQTYILNHCSNLHQCIAPFENEPGKKQGMEDKLYVISLITINIGIEYAHKGLYVMSTAIGTPMQVQNLEVLVK